MTPLLCARAVMIILETQKCRKGHLASSNLTFLLFAIDTSGFRRMKEEVTQMLASDFVILPRDLVLIFREIQRLVIIFQSLVMISPRCFNFERP